MRRPPSFVTKKNNQTKEANQSINKFLPPSLFSLIPLLYQHYYKSKSYSLSKQKYSSIPQLQYHYSSPFKLLLHQQFPLYKFIGFIHFYFYSTSSMAHQETVKVPTITLCNTSNLKPGTPLWETTKAQVFKALQEHGFFEAIYDEVPNETVEALFDSLEQVLPQGTKLKEYLNKPYGRYEGQIPHLPFNENAMHVADLILPQSVEIFANTLWPNGNPDFCNVVKSYYKPLIKLDEMVKMMILESIGIGNYRDELLNLSNVHNLRFIQYYKATHECEVDKMKHTDSGFLSIIKQNQAGLQALTKNGEWIELNVSPNSYIVLVSDSLMAWTNNRLSSATHRVIMKGDNKRSSVQLFSSPKPGHTVKAPKELVDEEHPLLFKPYDICQYYKYVTSGHENGSSLKYYFNVC